MKKIILMIIATLSLHSEIPNDKLTHAFAGMGIYVGCFFVKNIGESVNYDMGYLTIKTCLIPVVVAGVGKEIYDSQHDNHTADWQDAAATMVLPVATFVILEW